MLNNPDNFIQGEYSDMYGTEFVCYVLACDVVTGRLLIEDRECEIGERGWCSPYLVTYHDPD